MFIHYDNIYIHTPHQHRENVKKKKKRKRNNLVLLPRSQFLAFISQQEIYNWRHLKNIAMYSQMFNERK